MLLRSLENRLSCCDDARADTTLVRLGNLICDRTNHNNHNTTTNGLAKIGLAKVGHNPPPNPPPLGCRQGQEHASHPERADRRRADPSLECNAWLHGLFRVCDGGRGGNSNHKHTKPSCDFS